MIYGSVCSGIEAASVAWRPLGWRAAFFAEVDPFARAVLTERFPGVPLHGDFTTIKQDDYAAIDLLVAGTPCQDFSVAGLRAGLDGERGKLTVEFVHLARRLRPVWLVWENVPGILSADGGRAFGIFLGALAECGYGFAYRVLDAQHFGVPQRRRRVFLVGYLGDWRPAAAVLFERQSLRGDTAPRRETGQGIARPVAGCAAGGSDYRNDADTADNLIAYGLDLENLGDGGNIGWRDANDPSITLNTNGNIGIAHALRAGGFDASEDGTGRGTPLVSVAFQEAQTGVREYSEAGTLRSNGPGHDPVGTRIRSGMSVRRLTPIECERLQGFPDDHTLVTYRGKPAADGPRYRAIGNSMAVPCMRWIGERIALIQSLVNSAREAA